MAEGGERLKYEVQLNKPGLTSDEFERLVKSKLQSVLKGKQNETEEWYASKAKDIAGCFLLIQNKSNPDEIDKRRRSAERSADLIANVKDSPLKIKSDTNGKRGTTKREKEVVKNYHDYQEDLFNALENHYGIQKKENQTFSTINFCNNLDEILEHFLNMYSEEDKPTSNETTKNEREKLRAVFEISACILQLRLYGDMFIENDVLNMKHYERWRDHVLVISSFAVLVCILNLLGEKLGVLLVVDRGYVPGKRTPTGKLSHNRSGSHLGTLFTYNPFGPPLDQFQCKFPRVFEQACGGNAARDSVPVIHGEIYRPQKQDKCRNLTLKSVSFS